MKNLTAKEIKALESAAYECGLETTQENLQSLYDNDDITINRGRDGNKYAVCITEYKEAAVNVETKESLTSEEMEKVLF